MEDKIEVGEYVRTKDGIIDKVIIEYDGKCNNPNCDEKHISCKYNYYNEKDIVKHSKQPIGVIKCGDFVNGMEILHIDDNKLYVEWNNEFEEFTGFLENKDIKTILTKESYMVNCYKVGGENE